HREGLQISRPPARRYSRQVVLDCVVEGNLLGAAQRVEKCAVDQRRTVTGHQAVQALRSAQRDLRIVVIDPMAERSVLPAAEIRIALEKPQLFDRELHQSMANTPLALKMSRMCPA